MKISYGILTDAAWTVSWDTFTPCGRLVFNGAFMNILMELAFDGK